MKSSAASRRILSRGAVAAAGVALAVGAATVPASANPAGEWISTYRGAAKQSSSWSGAFGSTQLCELNRIL
ncbi:hypothetical protein GCM10009753_77900 [Streptantibioticus ferralitis]